MNSKQIALLVGLVVVVGFGGLWFKQRNEAQWSGGSSGAKLLASLPVGEALAQVVIRQGTNQLNLVKVEQRWQVRERGGYAADYAALSSAILKLRDLKPVQTEPVGGSQLGRLELAPSTATVVEFRDAAGKALETLTLGKVQTRKDARPSPMGDDGGGYPVGRWVMSGGSSNTAYLVSDPLGNLVPQATSWLNKDFIKVEKLKSIRVLHPEATNSWSVARETDGSSDWKLSDAGAGEELDSAKTSGFGWALNSPSFNDVLIGGSIGQPTTTLKLETFEGFTYTLTVGTKLEDALPTQVTVAGSFPKERSVAADEKPEDKAKLDKEFAENLKRLETKLAAEKSVEKWTYLLSSWTLDSLLKPRSELLKAASSPEPAGETPAAGGVAEPAAN